MCVMFCMFLACVRVRSSTEIDNCILCTVYTVPSFDSKKTKHQYTILLVADTKHKCHANTMSISWNHTAKGEETDSWS